MAIPGITPERVGGLIEQTARQISGSVKDKIGVDPISVFGSKALPQEQSVTIFGRKGGAKALNLSPWGNLSEHLIARMYALDKDQVEDASEGSIFGPITDATFEAAANWQSPFENMGAESKAPALMAMAQTGQFGTIINQLQATGLTDVLPKDMQKSLNDSANKAKQTSKDLTGRTGITKLNSRQVFSGMPPVKIGFTIHFRAISDPYAEVVQPYERLLRWKFPVELAEDGLISQVITNSSSENGSFLSTLFPSKSPVMIGMTYGKNRYMPMVIENVSHPIDGPISENGYPIYRACQVSIATLTALDRNDIKNFVIR